MSYEKLYDLPHRFEVGKQDGGYSLYCGNSFVYWNESLDRVFVVFGKHLETVKG